MKTVRLIPKKPSALVEFALASLLEVEREKEFSIVMKVWNRINPVSKKCEVCLAGAALIKAGFPKGSALETGIWNDDRFSRNQTKYEYINRGIALNSFRIGKIKQGLNYLGFTDSKIYSLGIPERIIIPTYKYDRDGFIKGLERIIKILKKAGI